MEKYFIQDTTGKYPVYLLDHPGFLTSDNLAFHEIKGFASIRDALKDLAHLNKFEPNTNYKIYRFADMKPVSDDILNAIAKQFND